MKYLALAALLALSACASVPNRWNESAAGLRVRSEIERKNGPAGDELCTDDYQRRTNYEFFEDDQPNCPNLRRPREQRR